MTFTGKLQKRSRRARYLAALATAAGTSAAFPTCSAFCPPGGGRAARHSDRDGVFGARKVDSGVGVVGGIGYKSVVSRTALHRKGRAGAPTTPVAPLGSTVAESSSYTATDVSDTVSVMEADQPASPMESLYQQPRFCSQIAAETSAVPRVVEIPEPRRKVRGREPELVIEGDKLVNTPKMLGLVYSSLALLALYFAQALSTISSPLEAGSAVVGIGAGVLLADLVSGVFHWSVDNYGNGNTPVFGAVIEAFQGHHASPWTITHRPFENNVHKICYAVLPLLALLRLVNPGPGGVTFGVMFLFGSLMSQELHRYAHMPRPPALAAALQDAGVIISRMKHGQHHRSPFEEKYCIVTGACNDPLDKNGVFRFLERVIYEINGVEPICWQLNPAVKAEAMGDKWAWLPRRPSLENSATSTTSGP